MPPDATAAPHRPMGPGAGGYTLGARCLRHSEQGKSVLFHFRFRRTAAICLIFPGCCRMSNISSVVLRCRVCAAACIAALGCCVCLCSAGIHRRAVGLLTPSSRAQAETEPPGCCLYHSCTRACCVGAPARLMRGSPAVNLVMLSPPALILPQCSPAVQ